MAPQEFDSGVAALFNSDRLSDVTIYCGDRQWFAHKVVICTQSQFFAKACEGRFKEASTGRIDLQDDDPDVVHGLLSYLYTGDYDVPTAHCDARVLYHVLVFALAEKLFVQSLLLAAAAKFEKDAIELVDPDQVADVIKLWYARTTDIDKILGNAIANGIMAYKSILVRENDELNAFHQALDLTRWLAPELASRLAEELEYVTDELENANAVRYFCCDECGSHCRAKFNANDKGTLQCPECGVGAPFKCWVDNCEYTVSDAEVTWYSKDVSRR